MVGPKAGIVIKSQRLKLRNTDRVALFFLDACGCLCVHITNIEARGELKVVLSHALIHLHAIVAGGLCRRTGNIWKTAIEHRALHITFGGTGFVPGLEQWRTRTACQQDHGHTRYRQLPDADKRSRARLRMSGCCQNGALSMLIDAIATRRLNWFGSNAKWSIDYAALIACTSSRESPTGVVPRTERNAAM